MSHSTGSLRAGITALKQERYLEAINLLESFCYCCSIQESTLRRPSERNGSRMDPSECVLAQVALVIAYQRSGDLERSAALCQELLEQTGIPETSLWAQEWAAQALPTLRQALEHYMPAEELMTRLPVLQQLEECQAFCSSRDPALHLLKSANF
ncbi:hypothetical protein L1047_00310 [Synechococcus sp. Nb3U1]|uniref:hypothetical protein n=1 Tax=Synechococcus sp. Nb3U1 TaxID=1914529 RepID=UPI001F17AFB9|nr:hypothetical protein [Synechococcus sp. Nb3U1]MCF2969640.1 hypothetical protein [Synechococcus sp. Nb3U1]